MTEFNEIESLIESLINTIHKMDSSLESYDYSLAKCRRLASEAMELLNETEMI